MSEWISLHCSRSNQTKWRWFVIFIRKNLIATDKIIMNYVFRFTYLCTTKNMEKLYFQATDLVKWPTSRKKRFTMLVNVYMYFFLNLSLTFSASMQQFSAVKVRSQLERKTDIEIFDVFLDVVGERLADVHALVRVVLSVSKTSIDHVLDDCLRFLHRKQHFRLQPVRVLVLNLCIHAIDQSINRSIYQWFGQSLLTHQNSDVEG